ncbi:MAG: HAD-IIB family hydrolase [Clostridia bacterium]|nr:HAD-IIB family hydrolase [Clostridia bacterium]
MTTKKYDGILLCTDYDGTLFYNGVNPRNLEAIREFTAGGGRFTLATGRANYEVRENDLPVKPNAPMLCMIGSRIWDFTEQKSLGDFTMDGSVGDVIRKICAHLREKSDVKLDDASVYRADKPFLFSNRTDADIEEGVSRIDGAYKVVFWLKEDYTPRLFKEVREICGDTCNLCSNREDILEITAHGVHKGSAVRRLKEILGAHTLICAGDFNGDIPMLRAADIGYAVENATDEVKAAADRVTVHAKDGAIAEIIANL